MTVRRVTKLYVKGACVSSRNNNFGISSSLSDVNCGNTTDDATQTTCMDVINNGAGTTAPGKGPVSHGRALCSRIRDGREWGCARLG